MDQRQPVPAAEIARIGPFFALGAGPGDGEGWRPAGALVGDAGELGRVIDQVAARLGAPASERWIAASVFHLGWAARLTAIYAGSAACCGAVPDLSAGRLRYRMSEPGPVELSAASLGGLSIEAGWRRLHDDHLEPLGLAIRRQVRIGSYLLRGNIGSALAGALAALARARQERLEALIGLGWARPEEVARSGRWLAAPGGPRYARTTCCGYDLLDQGGRCGDCSLNWLRPGQAEARPSLDEQRRPGVR